MGRKKKSAHHGVLVVDKPKGPTSHDIVSKARRVFQTRSIGHAGTLDPMATGVLVLAIGEGTKLVPYLTAASKEYVATIRLGIATDSLDAMGEVTKTCDVPERSDAQVRSALDGFLGTTQQVAPALSAIKQGGESLHKKVRRGETVVPPTRTVHVHTLSLIERSETELSIRVHAAKGFYVRSLARDVAQALGTEGHLISLRRERSGAFDLDASVTLEMFEQPEACIAKMVPMVEAHGLKSAMLSAAGKIDAFHGRPIKLQDVTPSVDELGTLCGLVAENQLVAIARREEACWSVVRGFRFE